MIWTLETNSYNPGGFGGAGGVEGFFLNKFNGFGGGGGPPAGGPAWAPGAAGLLPFLKGFIFFRSDPTFLNNFSGGGGAGGPLCAITLADICANPKVKAPARIYFVIFLKLFFRDDCIAVLFS